jgi:hypothetical protein
MAAAFNPGTTKKRIQLRQTGTGFSLDVEPVRRRTNSADAKDQEIGFATGWNVVRGCARHVVSGTAAFVDARAAELAGPFECALRHAP